MTNFCVHWNHLRFLFITKIQWASGLKINSKNSRIFYATNRHDDLSCCCKKTYLNILLLWKKNPMVGKIKASEWKLILLSHFVQVNLLSFFHLTWRHMANEQNSSFFLFLLSKHYQIDLKNTVHDTQNVWRNVWSVLYVFCWLIESWEIVSK